MYTFLCHKCGHTDMAFRKVDQRNFPPKCDECLNAGREAGWMLRTVDAPMVMTDMQPYRSMIDGRMIMSRSQHRDHLKSHGCIEIGNETKYLKPKEKIDLSPESKAARKQKIIEQVNHLKG
jgi:hypothetical protein